MEKQSSSFEEISRLMIVRFGIHSEDSHTFSMQNNTISFAFVSNIKKKLTQINHKKTFAL
jgi:hypothetical protein